MTRWQKTKMWVKENAEPLAILTITGAGIGLIVAAVRSDLKYQARQIEAHNAWADDMNQWVAEETEKGNAIYPIIDGSYLVVPEESPVAVVIK